MSSENSISKLLGLKFCLNKIQFRCTVYKPCSCTQAHPKHSACWKLSDEEKKGYNNNFISYQLHCKEIHDQPIKKENIRSEDKTHK